MPRRRTIAPGEERTARLTLLIDPRKKQVFEEVCAAEDVTPSQVVRRLIREYIESRLGQSWQEVADAGARTGTGSRKAPSRRT
jgi:hypothetical protein